MPGANGARQDALDASAADLPPDGDEFAFAGLTPVPARRVRPPRVAEAPAQRAGRVAPDLLDPVVRLGRRYGALAPVATPEEEPSPHVLG